MTLLTKLQAFLDNFLYFDSKLDIAKIDPYMANGLMVQGSKEIKKIGFGVSASLALFEKAKNADCNAVVVHHSFNLPAYNRFDSIFQNRIAYLIKNDISLFGYHFLLDAHPQIGNNVQLLNAIGAKPTKAYLHRGNPWGWIGECAKPVQMNQVEATLAPYLSKHTVVYPFGPTLIRRVVAVSGMGSPIPSVMHDLVTEKINLFITGEAHEWNRELFREAGIHFMAGGHYHTECFGIKALMEFVKKNISVETVWLDLVNEI